MRQTISKILTKIWGVAVYLLLFAGGITVLGFAAAFIAGGSTGERIAMFIYEDIFSVIIFATSILIVLGWRKMELSGELELTAGEKKSRAKKKHTSQ